MLIFNAGVRRLRNFLRNRKGASAIEFAIVAGPFLLLFFGLFDAALRYAGNVSLEHTVSEAGRFVRTGQAQQLGEKAFKQRVCEDVAPPISCNGLHFDIRTFESFEAAELTSPLNSDDELRDDFSYQPGGRNEIVVVRAFYEWPLLTYLPFFGQYGQGVLVATAAFRNEPF